MSPLTNGGGPVTSLGSALLDAPANAPPLWLLDDFQGSITDTADGSTTLTGTALLDPYGSPITTSGAAHPLRFHGQYQDSLTVLYDIRARDYNPGSGTFTAPDPVKPKPGTPYTSTYHYGYNNPAAFTDPSGEWGFLIKPVVGSHHRRCHRLRRPWRDHGRLVEPQRSLGCRQRRTGRRDRRRLRRRRLTPGTLRRLRPQRRRRKRRLRLRHQRRQLLLGPGKPRLRLRRRRPLHQNHHPPQIAAWSKAGFAKAWGPLTSPSPSVLAVRASSL
ncbi:RHS repeat-associated core domain-containing protein [Spirillospora sp. CA-255316]